MPKKPLILLVEDDREILRSLNLRLSAANYETIMAHDGQEGLATAIAVQPDAIVLDVRMPVMDGLTMLGILRQIETTENIPAVVLSANIAGKTKTRALELGARYFLEKPYEAGTLLQAIQSALSPETSNKLNLAV